VEGSKPHLTLFDTGPDSISLVRNIQSLKVPVSDIERVIISHWHADHSGGLLSFLKLRDPLAPPCVIDVHPDRPTARGIAPPPTFDKVTARLPPDPTFELIEKAGAQVEKSKEGHTVADGTIWVSGEIPRVTSFEGGLPGGVRWFESENDGNGGWVKDEVLWHSFPSTLAVY
jgi:7,8-dihydropterin-6-yl-methyl-4-(beta-D-ribofuranosyl)aminobenzene 5'-phosphate synthase